MSERATDTKRDGGLAAFPHDNQELGDKHRIAQPGMKLRDWFAGQALAAMDMPHDGEYAADDHIANGKADMDAKWRAATAYRMADAMLAQRAQGEDQ